MVLQKLAILMMMVMGQAAAADRDKTGTNAPQNPIQTTPPLKILAVPEVRSLGAERGNTCRTELPLLNWSFNPPSRPVQIALLAFVVAGMAVTPLVNRFNGASNKDYPLWYATGQKFVQGEPLYPTDGSVFPFMYPPFAGFALGAISLLGPTGMVVALVLLNAASFFLAVELSVRLVAGTPIVSLWLRTVPSAVCLFFVADMFTLGQPNLGLFVLILGGLMLLRHGHWGWAGTCFALATAIKAFPAVVLIYLLWRREWKAAGAMVLITAFLLVVVPAPQRGFERNAVELKTWADGMLFSGGEKGVGQRPEQSVSWRNQSLLGVGHRFLRPANAEADAFDAAIPPQYVNVFELDFKRASLVVLICSAILGLGFILVMPARGKRTRSTDAIEFSLLLLLMTIGTPYAFSYYFVWLILPLTVCVHRGLGGPRLGDRWLGWGGVLLVTVLFAAGIESAVTDDHTFMALGNLFWSAIVLVLALGAMLVGERRQPPR